MANMSYCRFENTLADLQDCLDAMVDGEDENLSASEQKAKERLIKLCVDIAYDFGNVGDED